MKTLEGSMLFFGLLIAFLSFSSHALKEVVSGIHEIDYGKELNDDDLILLENGHVIKISQSKRDQFTAIFRDKSEDPFYRFKIDENRFVIDITKEKRNKIQNEIIKKMVPFQYTPTTVSSLSQAKRYHGEARYNPKDSQCFNRAMIWSYEWWRDHELKSNKIFIFFTRNYIRKFNFEWWFHVAPYVHVLKERKIVERVMDIKYANSPLPIPSWTNIFMKNNAKCPVITKYSDYADFPFEGFCYIQRTHMFTYQPSDLQMYEAWGYTKKNFNFNEIKNAYKEAFDEEI